MSTVDEQARRVAIQHAVTQAADALAGQYQTLPDDERVARLDYLVAAINWYVVDSSEKTEAELKTYLTRLGAESQAWLEALEARAAQ